MESVALKVSYMKVEGKPPPFDPKIFLARIGTGKTRAELRKRQIVFSQGDPADAIFYIQKGKIELRVSSQQGKEAILATLGLDDLEKPAMIAAVHNEPEFSALFISYLLTRNIRIEEDLVDQLFNSSEKRLARLLLLLANFGKEGKPEAVIPKVSQETLAEMIGTTRSRVSFFMNKFRKLGFIEYNGGLSVHSSLLNVVLHD